MCSVLVTTNHIKKEKETVISCKSLRQKFVFSSAPIFQSGSSTDEETKTSILAGHGAFATLIAKTAQK